MRSENIDSNLTAKVDNSSYTGLPAIVEAFLGFGWCVEAQNFYRVDGKASGWAQQSQDDCRSNTRLLRFKTPKYPIPIFRQTTTLSQM
jgi:hypothetical protein